MASAPTAPIQVNLDITEAQMMEMSVNELEAYLAQVGAFVDQESSTIKGLTTEEGFYQTLIFNSETQIAGLNTSIFTNTANLNANLAEQKRVGDLIVSLDGSIKTAETDLALQEKIIQETTKTIGDLTTEDSNLSNQQAAAATKFDTDARTYSSLVQQADATRNTYNILMKNISDTTVLRDSTIKREAELRPPMEAAEAALKTAQDELSTLIGQEQEYIVALNKAILDESNAGRDLTNVIREVISVSSLYRAALINQRFVNAQSTFLGLTVIYQNAYQAFIDAQSSYQVNPTNATQSALTLANQLVNKTKGDADAAKNQVDLLSAEFNLVADTSYKATLDGLNMSIKTETDNISTFRSRKQIASKNVISFSSMMEQALADVRRLVENSRLYTTQSNSTLEGLAVLRTRETQQQAAVDSDTATIDSLNLTIGTLNTGITRETSSLEGYVKESSIATTNNRTATTNYNTYKEQANSTIAAEQRLTGEVGDLDTQIGDLTRTIDANTYTERQQDILIMKYQADASQKYSALEKAALEYRETYVRQKRLSTQILYEDLVTQQIQAASTLAAQQGTQGLGSVNLNTPEINAQLTMFTTINTYLADIAMTYPMYTTEATHLGLVIAACDSNLSRLSGGSTLTNDPIGFSTQAGGTRNTILTLLDALRAKHLGIFTLFEDTNQSRVISSIMENAYAAAI